MLKILDCQTACCRVIWCGLKATDLTVEPQKQKHDEEEDGPEGGQRHHGDRFWIGDKSQARTYMGTGEEGRGGRACG